MPLLEVLILLSQIKKYFGSLHRFVFSSFPVIIGSDFNCVDNPVIDRTFYDINLFKSYQSAKLINLCKMFDLSDSFRAANADLKQFTWYGLTVVPRLDRFYHDIGVTVHTCKTQPVSYSDHSIVQMYFSHKQYQNLRAWFWKNNTAVYDDVSCFNLTHWDQWVSLRPIYSNDFAWWIEAKARLRELLKKTS